jgi:hypothetical protein
MDLHKRIAAALRWTERDAQSFSLLTLRDLVRPVSPKLADEIAEVVRSGQVFGTHATWGGNCCKSERGVRCAVCGCAVSRNVSPTSDKSKE